MFTEIFVRENSNIFIVWVSFYFIIRSLRESICTIGSTWFILQEQVILGKFSDIPCDVWANFVRFPIISEVCMIGVYQDGDFCAFEQVRPAV